MKCDHWFSAVSIYLGKEYLSWIFLAILLYTQIKFLSWLGHPPFLSLFTVECVSWYWVGRTEKKKKSQEVSE